MASTTAAKAPSTPRLPRARESRPMLIGLAVLLIVGGALASAWLATQAGHRAYFVSIDREVSQGAEITDGDLTRVSLPEGFEDGISSADKDSVVGKTAATRLHARHGAEPGDALEPDRAEGEPDAADGARGRQPVRARAAAGRADGPLGRVGRTAEAGRRSARSSCPSARTAAAVASGRIRRHREPGRRHRRLVPVVGVPGVEDKTVTPALIGGSDNTAVQTTCRD